MWFVIICLVVIVIFIVAVYVYGRGWGDGGTGTSSITNTCGGDELDVETSSFVKTQFKDPRDGNVYRVVKIGNQVWMAENLRYKVWGSWCCNNNKYNGQQYGRLYTWEAAKRVCPPGWHLPTDEEWDTLVEYVGGDGIAGYKLKAKTGWNDYYVERERRLDDWYWPDPQEYIRTCGYTCECGDGTDEYGFSALPGAGRESNGSFLPTGVSGIWWTATETGASKAYSRGMGHCSGNIYASNDDKSAGFSVRCVKD
jgi:uncharacterized protein (TIGR02145 family)